MRYKRFAKYLLAVIPLIGLSAIAYVDYVTGELSMSALYIAPILFVAYKFNKNAISFAVLSSLVETSVMLLDNSFFSFKLLHTWNMVMNMVIYITTAYLMSSLRDAYQREADSARTDILTGIANRTGFIELASREVERAKRHKTVLSLAFIDCDNFKQINDTLGHDTGDILLKRVAYTMKANTRVIDIVGRLGGDEFVVLLADADFEESQIVIEKLHTVLMATMKKNNWAVSFSIGVATFISPHDSLETLLKAADKLMYDVKNSGKNMIKHGVFSS